MKQGMLCSPEVYCVCADVSGQESASQTKSVVEVSFGHQPERKIININTK